MAAINNKFVLFENSTTFENRINDLHKDAIVFIKDSNCIYTHGKYFYCADNKVSEELAKYCTKEEYNTLVDKIWNTQSDFFQTVNTLNDGSYAKLWNENSGGGSQFYNAANNHLNFVGVNNGNDGVDVLIYSKDKTSGVGVRINVNTEKAYYGKGTAAEVNQDNNEIATVGTVKSAIAEIVDNAPETFDTLKEISDYISENESVVGGLVDTINTKASKEELTIGLDTKQDKGNYLEYNDEDGRKVVTLNNTDIFGAKANTEELENKIDITGWISLLQLNKWNVVDLGSPKTLTNINTPKGVRPTVQEAGQSGIDAHLIAYLSDITTANESVSALSTRVDDMQTNLDTFGWAEF